MPTNDFLPFATGTSPTPNVQDQASYAADAVRGTGFQSGVAPSPKVNKAIRQGSFIAACIAKFTSDTASVDTLDDGDVPGFVAKFINALRTLLGTPPGAVMFGYWTTAPTGYLKLNGVAVSLTTYPNLGASYCGDSPNSTATHWYRCTDPLNPTATRSTTGGYIMLPDWRASFPRALDDGRGIDAGRTLYGPEQMGMVESHTHRSAGAPGTGQGAPGGDFVQQSGSSTETTAYGGVETRPRNMAVLAVIKF